MKNIAVALCFLFIIGCNSKEGITETRKNDEIQNESSNQKQKVDSTIKHFLIWYRDNYKELSQIDFATKEKNDRYYVVNFDNVNLFIEKLRASGYLSDAYLANLKQYFNDCNKSLLEEKIEEGEIDCLGFDLILNTHEIDESLSKVETAKIRNTILKSDSATANIELVYKLKFALSENSSFWKIDKIEALPDDAF
ncbi:hypothetical protein I5M27_09565 [Adhaeribacter sp. BT258]|uniref:DUF3828 domain-containing protein n=1 Tax=Adhaeribacter terrigena TaxID=2793070 RepID=A0ABS1C3L8_9BACT|nr:hypothetical protein [Adhaeribacter terrigena]MBK0403233.1 hypothetical protein [Adhaeribacter terrigena]